MVVEFDRALQSLDTLAIVNITTVVLQLLLDPGIDLLTEQSFVLQHMLFEELLAAGLHLLA